MDITYIPTAMRNAFERYRIHPPTHGAGNRKLRLMIAGSLSRKTGLIPRRKWWSFQR